MNKLSIVPIVLAALLLMSFKQDKPAYILYRDSGKNVKYKKMIKELKDADVVFFGEYHNNPISHWLQYEVTNSLYKATEGAIVMGTEMFEADNQLILDEYVNGLISTSRFEAECKLWGNYKTDYKHLVTFAKDSAISLIATNIPRRYAAMVHKQGIESLDKLTDQAKSYIAPLPINFDNDSVLIKKMGMMAKMSKNPVGIAKAQTIKDATMAYFISQNLKKNTIFIHYNGTFHSNNREGIVHELKKLNPNIKIKIISTVEQEDITKLGDENENIADYIICVPQTMIKTY